MEQTLENADSREVVIESNSADWRYWTGRGAIVLILVFWVAMIAIFFAIPKKGGAGFSGVIGAFPVILYFVLQPLLAGGDGTRRLRISRDRIISEERFARRVITRGDIASISIVDVPRQFSTPTRALELRSAPGMRLPTLLSIPSAFQPPERLLPVLEAWHAERPIEGPGLVATPPVASPAIPPGWVGWAIVWIALGVLGALINLARVPIFGLLMIVENSEESLLATSHPMFLGTTLLASLIALLGHGWALFGGWSILRQKAGARSRMLTAGFILLGSAILFLLAAVMGFYLVESPAPEARREVFAPMIASTLVRILLAGVPIHMILRMQSDDAKASLP